MKTVASLQTNMPWAVYRCEKLHVRSPHPAEMEQEFISGHLSPGAAMDEANRLARLDPENSYVVGCAA